MTLKTFEDILNAPVDSLLPTRSKPPVPNAIDLFGDGSITVEIRRHRSRLKRWRGCQLPSTTPMCFNPQCADEASSNGIAIILRARNQDAQGIAMVGCASCSQLRNDKILPLIRENVRGYFGLGGQLPKDGFVDNVESSGCTVAGIELAIINGVDCPHADAFRYLLSKHMLPQFSFAYRSVGNCFAIVHHLTTDFADLGLANLIQPKVGFAHRLLNTGKPLGRHAWIEWGGFAIDAANGGAGKPVIFERTEEYIARCKVDGVCDFKKEEVSYANPT